MPAKVDHRWWTTDDQEAWLTEKLPGYLNAASVKRFDKFWPGLNEQWFLTFPKPSTNPKEATDSEDDPESDNQPPSNNDVLLPLRLKRKKSKCGVKGAAKKPKTAVCRFEICSINPFYSHFIRHQTIQH